jgi:hypothetical protein
MPVKAKKDCVIRDRGLRRESNSTRKHLGTYIYTLDQLLMELRGRAALQKSKVLQIKNGQATIFCQLAMKNSQNQVSIHLSVANLSQPYFDQI